jgi:hypothetical protein
MNYICPLPHGRGSPPAVDVDPCMQKGSRDREGAGGQVMENPIRHEQPAPPAEG